MRTIFSRLLAVGLLFLAAGAVSTPACAQSAPSGRLGSVNGKRLLEESAPAKSAYARIQAELRPRQLAIQAAVQKRNEYSDALQKDWPKLTDAERTDRQRKLAEMDRTNDRDQRTLEEDLNARRSQELSPLLEAINTAIKRVAEANNYDIVVQEAYYAGPKADITDQVLAELAKSSGSSSSPK